MIRQFDDFVELRFGSLASFSAALTGDRELAHDILVDALIRVERHWRRIGDLANPVAYVRRVIVSTFLDHLRKESRWRTRPYGQVADRAVPDQAVQVEQREDLEQLLRLLTPHQSAAITMRFFSDMDDQAIGGHLGCSAATARSHISHGLRTLRRVSMDERSVE